MNCVHAARRVGDFRGAFEGPVVPREAAVEVILAFFSCLLIPLRHSVAVLTSPVQTLGTNQQAPDTSTTGAIVLRELIECLAVAFLAETATMTTCRRARTKPRPSS